MRLAKLSSTVAIVGLTICAAEAQRPRLVVQPVDETKLVTLAGNTRPEASAENDRGRVDDGLRVEHMLLQLERSPQQERELEKTIAGLHDPKSPLYHRWFTAEQFGARFGLAAEDLAAIRSWLESHGLEVNSIYRSGMLMDISGTAGQVREAFHTDIHRLSAHGEDHIANMANPKIPEALAPAIAGIVSLHDFRPRTALHVRTAYTAPYGSPAETYYNVGPADLAVIYNLNPLFKQSNTGLGQTIALIEETDLYSNADWMTFRTTFGLDAYKGARIKTVHPRSTGKRNNCIDPGINGASIEAAVDVEYATAAAPEATVEVVACNSSGVTFGGIFAVENLLNGKPPSIMSMSYGECEEYLGAAANRAYSRAYQQADSMGVSVFVSTGDYGTALCESNTGELGANGIAVNGFASTPYNVAVGGTDFGDYYAGTVASYWNSTNTQDYESALSYVPEIPWNDTCASELIASYLGFPNTYGPNSLCNSTAQQYFQYQNSVAGSGGPSACATGTPDMGAVVSGTCKGYKKPSWQSGVAGIPNDGVRGLPDVSLFAANGAWGHFYPLCYSYPGFGGVPCTGAPNTWLGAGGTSFAAPIMAGIQALVNQKYGAQGNPNPVYYQLAAHDYGTNGNSSCNSTLGNAISATCTFHDITLGDNDVPCYSQYNCYEYPGNISNGVMLTDDNSYQPHMRQG